MTERDDETQAMPSPLSDDGEATQLMPGGDVDDEPTRMMPRSDEATRRIGRPATSGADPTRRLSVPSAAEPAPTRRMDRRSVTSGPVTERLTVPEARRDLARGLIAVIVVVALLAGGVVGYLQHEPSDANVVARALVGPDGGVITFDGAGKLTVPSGALPSPTAITIRRDTIDQRVRLGAEGDPNSVAYEPGELVVYAFEPPDLRFQQPVTIELPRTGDASAVFVDARGSPRVVQGTASGNLVQVETTSFSFDDAAGTDGSR